MTPCCLWAVYVICKLGNDSQKAVQLLEKMSTSEVGDITVKDICGGLMAWSQKINPKFPQYWVADFNMYIFVAIFNKLVGPNLFVIDTCLINCVITW